MAFIACLEAPTSSPNCSCRQPSLFPQFFYSVFHSSSKSKVNITIIIYVFSCNVNLTPIFCYTNIYKTGNDTMFQISFPYIIPL